MPKTEDKIRFDPDGRIRLSVAGTEHRLRRATIGETRTHQERLRDLQDEAKALSDRVKTDDNPDGDLTAVVSLEQQTALVLDEWRWLVETLGDGKNELPDDNDVLPPWLTDFSLITECAGHWRQAPLEGRLPSLAAIERQTQQLEAAKPVMEQLARLNGASTSARA